MGLFERVWGVDRVSHNFLASGRIQHVLVQQNVDNRKDRKKEKKKKTTSHMGFQVCPPSLLSSVRGFCLTLMGRNIQKRKRPQAHRFWGFQPLPSSSQCDAIEGTLILIVYQEKGSLQLNGEPERSARETRKDK